MNASSIHPETFPLPFPYLRIYSQNIDTLGTAPFVVSGMLTKSHAHHAERLIQSCKQFDLPYILYEIPAVHRSISPKGIADLSLTKANFIWFLLESHQSPVLYLDVDCFMSAYPTEIKKLVRDGRDFAIYNWLADEHTECYVPVEMTINVGKKSRTFKNRFYRFSHSVDYYTTEQLICSGAVQFYNNTSGARALLRTWHEAISLHPGTSDDACLDYAFNNHPAEIENLKTAWLKKSYARYAWWIYERPIINHPDIPSYENAFQPIPDDQEKKRFYPEQAQLKIVNYYFPRDCLIDTEKKVLMKMQAGQLIPWQPLTRQLWL